MVRKQHVAKRLKIKFCSGNSWYYLRCLLFIISFIASQSVTIPFSDAGKITVGYSAIKSFLSGFVCGTLFTLVGFIAHTSKTIWQQHFKS